MYRDLTHLLAPPWPRVRFIRRVGSGSGVAGYGTTWGWGDLAIDAERCYRAVGSAGVRASLVTCCPDRIETRTCSRLAQIKPSGVMEGKVGRSSLVQSASDPASGADGIGPDPDATGRWPGNPGSAHGRDQP